MAKHLERYREMLAGRDMAIGDQVVCTFRCPTPHQWWIHPWHVGVIEEPSDDVASWNGHDSEAQYCANCLYVKVRYLRSAASVGFTMLDSLANLLPLTGDPVTESPYFGSGAAEAIRLYQFACRTGLGDRYAEKSQKAWHELNRRQQLTDAIQAGAKVTIVNRFGQQRTGRAVTRGPAGWVLNMGGQYGTPAIVTGDNIVAVKSANGKTR